MATSTSAFPRFVDGDVHIIVNGTWQFILHKEVLASQSSTFRGLLTEESAAMLSKSAIKKGVKIRWRLCLEDEQEDAGGRRLVRVPLDGNGRPAEGFEIPLNLENGMAPNDVGETFSNVLGAMYGRVISLGDFHSDSLKDMIECAYRIAQIATELDVIDIITHPMEAHLLSHGPLLFGSIANSPGRWLEFAISVKSRLIFREALIHAVGQYNTPDIQAFIQPRFDGAPSALIQLLIDKHDKLQTDLKNAQMSILTYYPANLQRDLTVGLVDRDKIGRNSYQNDIFSWMAINAFRHWVSQNVLADFTHHAEDMGYEFFNLVARGEDAYLTHDDLEDFYKLFPLTKKGESVIESAIGNLKEHCRQFAKPFLVNTSQLDKSVFPCAFFSCVKVSHEDYTAMGE